MKYKVREMIKNVIEENAVSFKEKTSQVLLNKVGNVLSEKYVEISQKIFEDFDDERVLVGQRIPGQPNGQTAVATAPAYMGSLYDPTNVFWSTDAGRSFMVGWNYLVRHYQNESAWGRPGFPAFMASAEAFLAYLRQRASENGTVAPPFPPLQEGVEPPNGGVTPPPENPGHGGGFYDRTQNPNRRPEYAGPSAPKNPGHGGGFYDRPTNRSNRRPESTRDSERPTESYPTYNPQDPWWRTNEGRMWQTYYSYWTVNAQNPDAWGTNDPSLPPFASANDLLRYLANQADKAPVVPPWVYSPPNG